ncbi:MAG: acyl carrier protein [Propionibacteriaceae bacterium]|mgnify:FL=1|nr:acyl carrier protein [Propionibacteriaceae bacterium]
MTDHADGDLAAIREALEKFGRLNRPLPEIADDDDLFAAGFTSHATVNVMLAIEDALAIEFPDELLNRTTFASITALANAAAQSRGSR